MYQLEKSNWFVVGPFVACLLSLGCAHAPRGAATSRPRVAEHMLKPTVIPPEVVMTMPPPAEREAHESVATSSVAPELKEPIETEP